MDKDQIILGKMARLEDYGDYLGSSMNEQVERIAELEGRIAELESIILKAKNIDWKTVKYRVDETFKESHHII
jgi:hypothetical protein